MTAADDHVGASVSQLGEHLGEKFRGMLQVGVHAAKDVAASDAPSGDDGGGKVALVLPFVQPEPRTAFGGETENFVAGAVGAAVVHDDEFVLFAALRQRRAGALDQTRDVGPFVVGGNDQRNHPETRARFMPGSIRESGPPTRAQPAGFGGQASGPSARSAAADSLPSTSLGTGPSARSARSGSAS